MDGDGPREDGVAGGGAPEVVDAELHAGDAAVSRGHVRAHARQALRDQRRHAAVEHLVRLPAGRPRARTQNGFFQFQCTHKTKARDTTGLRLADRWPAAYDRVR